MGQGRHEENLKLVETINTERRQAKELRKRVQALARDRTQAVQDAKAAKDGHAAATKETQARPRAVQPRGVPAPGAGALGVCQHAQQAGGSLLHRSATAWRCICCLARGPRCTCAGCRPQAQGDAAHSTNGPAPQRRRCCAPCAGAAETAGSPACRSSSSSGSPSLCAKAQRTSLCAPDLLSSSCPACSDQGRLASPEAHAPGQRGPCRSACHSCRRQQAHAGAARHRDAGGPAGPAAGEGCGPALLSRQQGDHALAASPLRCVDCGPPALQGPAALAPTTEKPQVAPQVTEPPAAAAAAVATAVGAQDAAPASAEVGPVSSHAAASAQHDHHASHACCRSGAQRASHIRAADPGSFPAC